MKPEEVTDEMYAAFCTAYTNGPAATFMSYCAGIAAAITVHERDAGRGQLPPLTEVPEHVIAAIEKYIGHSIWKNLGEASRLINIALVCLNADRATPAGATSSPVIHKFGDQYVAVCGDDAVNHKITEFWEYVTCKDCLKKGSAAPAEDLEGGPDR